MEESMSKVEGDIMCLQDRISTAETANKKADASIDIAKSLKAKFSKMEQKMAEPNAIQHAAGAVGLLLHWAIIIAVILLAWVLSFKMYIIVFFLIGAGVCLLSDN